MENRKQVHGIIKIVILTLSACVLLIISAVYYKGGAVDRAIFNFGVAMLIGMYSSAGIISQKLDNQLSYFEKLIERLENKDD